jgi:hypothetical protein
MGERVRSKKITSRIERLVNGFLVYIISHDDHMPPEGRKGGQRRKEGRKEGREGGKNIGMKEGRNRKPLPLPPSSFSSNSSNCEAQ